MSKWQSKAPKPPEKGEPSDWYWYWDPGKEEPWVVEVSPGRYLKHFKGSWWSGVISRPPKKPKGISNGTTDGK